MYGCLRLGVRAEEITDTFIELFIFLQKGLVFSPSETESDGRKTDSQERERAMKVG